jgi:hypothetical protein
MPSVSIQSGNFSKGISQVNLQSYLQGSSSALQQSGGNVSMHYSPNRISQNGTQEENLRNMLEYYKPKIGGVREARNNLNNPGIQTE